jgi:general secretion pathway protein A
MYEDYWNLKHAPFENDADPDYFFPGRSHQGALLKLQYLVEGGKGIGVLAGDSGSGKSYLTHVLAAGLDPARFEVIRLSFPFLESSELLAWWGRHLGTRSAGREQDRLLDDILSKLREFTAANRQPVLVLDEAHLLSEDQLQVLQILSGLSQETGCRLSLILVGRNELLVRVNHLRSLADRITVRAGLHAFDAAETREYVLHRLETAGATGCMFDDDALRAFHHHSLGLPRKINQICDLALLVGFADGLRRLCPIDVQAAADELAEVSVD